MGPELPEECLEVVRQVSDNFLTKTELNDGQICCLRLRNNKIETKMGKWKVTYNSEELI